MTWVAVAIGGSALVGAGVSSYEGKQNRKQSKGLINDQKARTAQLDAYGKPLLQQGQQNMETVQDYLRRLSSGNTAVTQQAIAPEINALTQGQQGATAQMRSQYGRGGQTASQASMLPYALQGQIANTMFGARTQAMGQLGTLGANQGSLGLSAMGQGGGLTNSLLNYGLQARQQQFDMGAAMGQGVGGFAQYMMYRGNNGGSNSPYTPTAYAQRDTTPVSQPASNFSLLGNTAGTPNSTAPGFSNPYSSPYGSGTP